MDMSLRVGYLPPWLCKNISYNINLGLELWLGIRLVSFSLSPPTMCDQRLFVFRSAVRLAVNIYSVLRDISVLSGGIAKKLGTDIHHVSGHCWKGFQGQRSKVKVTARSNALVRRRLTPRRCSAEATLFSHWSSRGRGGWSGGTMGGKYTTALEARSITVPHTHTHTHIYT